MVKSIAVFCGSNFGIVDDYAEGARQLARELAERRITLVYGGTTKGLMGVLADEVLAAGGEVVGVINRRLHERGHLHSNLTRHEIVSDMRARKARMAELSDAFIALPGGLGTLEELFEMATLTQLGDHAKACGALNTRGYYEPMWAMLERAVDEGFLKPEHRDMMVLDREPGTLLDRLAAWKPLNVTKWIGQAGS
jgi:uncharacterized protein (TIGR00730 family)